MQVTRVTAMLACSAQTLTEQENLHGKFIRSMERLRKNMLKSSTSIQTRLLDTLGVLRFDSRRGLGIFLFTTASRTIMGPTQLPIQWVPGALPLGIKRPGREADHSPSSSAEVKE